MTEKSNEKWWPKCLKKRLMKNIFPTLKMRQLYITNISKKIQKENINDNFIEGNDIIVNF